jgi:hypothetical protein
MAGKAQPPVISSTLGREWPGISMRTVMAKHPVMTLVLIWATLLLAVWIIPSDPPPRATVAEPAKVGHFAPGMAAVRRLVAVRHTVMPD